MQSPRVTSLKRPDLHAVGFPSDDRNEPFMKPKMKIVDVPRYEHYDNDDYPLCSAYFMYGDKKETFLFHIPTRNPDFLQVEKSPFMTCHLPLVQNEPHHLIPFR